MLGKIYGLNEHLQMFIEEHVLHVEKKQQLGVERKKSFE